MISKNMGRALFFILLVVMFVGQGCGGRILSTPSIMTVTATEAMTLAATKTLSLGFIETANFLETASMKDIILTEIPTVTTTITPAPPGTFALFFYSPLIMNYDTSIWEIKNVLRVKELASCFIGEQGPTDFNGPHSEQIVRLGEVNYTVLSFPYSPLDYIRHAYLADPSLATEAGLPVFWVGAKFEEWNECKKLAADVLATLRSPTN